MSLASATVKPPLRPVFEPLFPPLAPSVPVLPATPAVAPAAEATFTAAELRRRLDEAEHAAYERGFADGLHETAAGHLAKARAHFGEAAAQIEALLAAVAERERERAQALDDALRALAGRLAGPEDRHALHVLFGRYVTRHAARLRSGELRRFAVSPPALQYLEAEFPEFLAALRGAGVSVEAARGEATAIFERADGEQVEIDFDALMQDIRVAFGGPAQRADKGDTQ